MSDTQPQIMQKGLIPFILGDLLFFVFISFTGFLLFLGAVPLFDWDEINFAECAREMIETQNYLQVQINFRPFHEKPPLFIWLQCLSMNIFGINEFGARFPNAFFGVLTIISLYLVGLQLKGRLFGRIIACLYLGTMLPVIYFKSGIIDPVFNFFIFLSLVQIYYFEVFERSANLNTLSPWLAGLWLGLAVLTKGPAALLIVGLTYFIFNLSVYFHRFAWGFILKLLFATGITVSLWYGAETFAHGTGFIEKFIAYQIELLTQPVAGHEQPFYYHFVIFILGCFPLSAFTFSGMFRKHAEKEDRPLRRMMMIWFWVVMIIFSISKTKIVHYSSLLYFPAVFISGLYLEHIIRKSSKIKWETGMLYIIGMILWGILPSCINLVINHLDWITPYVKDPVAQGNLAMEVEWTGYEWLIGGVFFTGLVFNLGNLFRRRYISFLYLQVMLTLFFVNGQYKRVLPGIARYTQGAAQDFFTAQAGKEVYLVTGRYKSYLHLFYGKVKPHKNINAYNDDWLIQGDPDKPVFLATKNILYTEEFQSRLSLFEKIEEKGGFLFFKRNTRP